MTDKSEKAKAKKSNTKTAAVRRLFLCKKTSSKPKEKQLYVLTYINNMLTHINAICLHISEKSSTFVVEKEREINLINPLINKAMKTISIEMTLEEIQSIRYALITTATYEHQQGHTESASYYDKLWSKYYDESKKF